MKEISQTLIKLQKSKFRRGFDLEESDKAYIDKKGLEKIKEDAENFLVQKIKIRPKNDGRQTPWKGHPTFIAQHATATCCRKCMEKWYGIDKRKTLSDEEIRFFKELIVEWIEWRIDYGT